MYYYKFDTGYAMSDSPISQYQEITKEEYLEGLKQNEPTEEEIRAEKEAQLRALMAELYPPEES